MEEGKPRSPLPPRWRYPGSCLKRYAHPADAVHARWKVRARRVMHPAPLMPLYLRASASPAVFAALSNVSFEQQRHDQRNGEEKSTTETCFFLRYS